MPISSHSTECKFFDSPSELASWLAYSVAEQHYWWHCFLALSIPKKVDTWDLTFSGSVRYAASHIGYHFTVSRKTTVNINFKTQGLCFKFWPCHSLDVWYHVSHLASLSLCFLLGKTKTVSICNGYLLILLPCIHSFPPFHCYGNNITILFWWYDSTPLLVLGLWMNLSLSVPSRVQTGDIG